MDIKRETKIVKGYWRTVGAIESRIDYLEIKE